MVSDRLGAIILLGSSFQGCSVCVCWRGGHNSGSVWEASRCVTQDSPE